MICEHAVCLNRDCLPRVEECSGDSFGHSSHLSMIQNAALIACHVVAASAQVMDPQTGSDFKPTLSRPSNPAHGCLAPITVPACEERHRLAGTIYG